MKPARQQAARHGMTAHVLYDVAHQLRGAALDLLVIADSGTAEELRSIAKRLDARRRRVMAGPPER